MLQIEIHYATMFEISIIKIRPMKLIVGGLNEFAWGFSMSLADSRAVSFSLYRDLGHNTIHFENCSDYSSNN